MKTDNIKKYGKKEEDIIQLQFDISFASGVSFCLGNVQKYLRRYISDSEKGNNLTDIIKVYDYLERLNVQKLDYIYMKMINNIMDFIKKGDYKNAFNLSVTMQKDLINRWIN